MKPYKAILVGNGTMGKRHRMRFEACGVQFAAVVDNLDEFNGISDKLNSGTAGGLPVDFVVIASPAVTHYAYAKFFVERRIPVFVEKPLATTAGEAQELVDLAVDTAESIAEYISCNAFKRREIYLHQVPFSFVIILEVYT